MTKHYVFIPDKILPEDFVFGAKKLPEKVLQVNGDWSDYLPVDEFQERNGLETSNCATFGTLNALEILFNRLFGKKMNWSERFIGVLAGTTWEGNTPQKVIQTIRHSGLIDDQLLPFDNSIDEWGKYYSPNPMAENYIDMGRKFLEKYEVSHEWVFQPEDKNKKEKLMEELKVSPLGISVYAWEEQDGLFVKPDGENDNHWCSLYGYEKDKYWKIFDSYDNTKKKLAWDYDFGFAKRYHIKKKDTINIEKGGYWEKFVKYLRRYFEEIIA